LRTTAQQQHNRTQATQGGATRLEDEVLRGRLGGARKRAATPPGRPARPRPASPPKDSAGTFRKDSAGKSRKPRDHQIPQASEPSDSSQIKKSPHVFFSTSGGDPRDRNPRGTTKNSDSQERTMAAAS